MVLLDILFFAVGLGLLVKGSDFVVDSAARIAKQAGVSEFIIGLTIVGIGTSLPETSNAITASLFGNPDVAIGNILGSNLSNIAFILGLSAVFVTVRINKEIYDRDCLFLFASVILFLLFSIDGVIGMHEGLFMLLLFSLYMAYFIATKPRFSREFHYARFAQDVLGFKSIPAVRGRYEFPSFSPGLDYYAYREIAKAAIFEIRKILALLSEITRGEKRFLWFLFFQIILFFGGIAMLVLGSGIVVKTIVMLPFSPLVVSLVVVSLGTTIPEMMVALAAIRKGYPEIMIGNTIGSVITNTLFIGGIAAVIRPVAVPENVAFIYLPFLVFASGLFLVFIRNDYRISRIEGVFLLAFYLVFVAMSFYFR